jgi:putative peptide zinc metalloprotease protein
MDAVGTLKVGPSELDVLAMKPERTVPVLRQELTLHVGPTAPDGSPTWTLHDPIRNQYFALDWISFEVIKRLGLGSTQAIEDDIETHTPYLIDTIFIEQVFDFLMFNELVAQHNASGSEWLLKKHQSQHKTFIKNLMHSYLFVRVPLFKPDALLNRITPALGFLFSGWFFKITMLAFLLGLWGVFGQWQTFTATLVDTFSWSGLAGYAGAIVVVKILHEFGHALTAKRMGCRVPTMGIAFLVMFPMAYTDVTESWKLSSHRKRFVIASAGIVTEVVLAAWMLFFWMILPDGNVRAIAFFLATTSLTTTLLINGSPFMRFDGYFLLSDFVNMPNLHQRCFAMGRWWLREKLFRFNDLQPEAVTIRKQRAMIAFAFIVWLYRFVVFLGIAFLVYEFFFKALGIILFVVELWYFVARPIAAEFAVWHKRRADIGKGFVKRPAFYVLMALILFLVLPFDFTVNSQGVFKPAQSFTVITDRFAVLQAPLLPVGHRVAAGEPLVSLNSFEIDHALKVNAARIHNLQQQVSSMGFSDESRREQAILREQLDSLGTERTGLLADLARLRPRASFDGVITQITPDINVGDTVPKATKLLTLADPNTWIVDTYVSEADLQRIGLNNWGLFIPDTPERPSVRLKVIAIDRDASRTLTDPSLAATSGGDILVRRTQSGALITERAIYRVRLQAESTQELSQGGLLRGSVVILGWPQSILGEFFRGAAGALMRELGF